MKTVTQTMLYRQALIKYSLKYGVTKAAIRYKTNRQYIYRWRKRYDGTLESLADKSHRPHHHPNEHTAEELKLIADRRFKQITDKSSQYVGSLQSGASSLNIAVAFKIFDLKTIKFFRSGKAEKPVKLTFTGV